jgi:hypothetical protein
MTFITNLQKEKDIFNSMEFRKYDKKAMLEVLQYVKNNPDIKTNPPMVKFISEKENIPTELMDYLATEVYLARHDIDEEKEEIAKQKMLDMGYLPLNRDTTYRGKIELVATTNTDFFTTNISKEATIKELSDNRIFIIPKGNRSRGWYITSLENAYYKPITKTK